MSSPVDTIERLQILTEDELNEALAKLDYESLEAMGNKLDALKEAALGWEPPPLARVPTLADIGALLLFADNLRVDISVLEGIAEKAVRAAAQLDEARSHEGDA